MTKISQRETRNYKLPQLINNTLFEKYHRLRKQANKLLRPYELAVRLDIRCNKRGLTNLSTRIYRINERNSLTTLSKGLLDVFSNRQSHTIFDGGKNDATLLIKNYVIPYLEKILDNLEAKDQADAAVAMLSLARKP